MEFAIDLSIFWLEMQAKRTAHLGKKAKTKYYRLSCLFSCLFVSQEIQSICSFDYAIDHFILIWTMDKWDKISVKIAAENTTNSSAWMKL